MDRPALGLAELPDHMNDESAQPRSAFMKMQSIAALLVLTAAGCTSPAAPDPQQSAITALGTPFLIAFKIPVCAVTVALAAPLAGATGLSPTYDSHVIRAELDQSVRQNCGPPYVLAP